MDATESTYVVGLHKRELRLGKGDIRTPGEGVPEANEWPLHVLNSHLSLRWLMLRTEFQHVKKAEEARTKKKLQEKEEHELLRQHARTNTDSLKPPKDPSDDIPKDTAGNVPKDPTDDVPKNPPQSGDGLDALIKTALQAKCREQKLPINGNKEALKKRLREAAV